MVTHATIYYQPEGYVTSGEYLMGRHAAGEGFLRAAARSGANYLECHTDSTASAQHFAGQLAQHGFNGRTGWVPTNQPAGLRDSGCLFLPGPNLIDSAWNRAFAGERTYSLCGITHTTATHRSMSTIAGLLTSPARSWDALICTSTCVRDTVRFLLENQADYLTKRIGASRFELPQFPVIPLGVHANDYEFGDGNRSLARQELGIAENEVVFLYVRQAFISRQGPSATDVCSA
jgi:alpha-maltose-1-phosphate synthase